MNWKPRRGRLSPREKQEQINAWHRFAGAMSIKPDGPKIAEQFVKELPPKRDRVKRPVPRTFASEHQEQCTVISWWWRAHKTYNLPHFALFAVPNGGARDEITGARLKAEGVRRGALDLILAKPTTQFSGLFIEMKVGKNQPNDDQKAFVSYLESVGYKASVHWSAASAIKEIEWYLGALLP